LPIWILQEVLASLFSGPGIAQEITQMSDAASLAGVIDLHAHVAPETAALNYQRSVTLSKPPRSPANTA
jgi:hypothetical protein